ncbi:MAG: hypothetical protein O9284_00235 [Steroidobacteraceae bacterium]|jgi:hypothetical protein|nr:hypothetical protein [Steroidobacteraceae bacterium]
MARTNRSLRTRTRPARRSRSGDGGDGGTTDPRVEAERIVTALRDALELVERELARLRLPRDRR